ncbi:Hypothetical protein FKW44_014972 [Caligus rogercresseyi]|uniref:Uncharacterized protein n=1 Tax=Caligus rogercresseyi TaxID=217165 RepID=A0A7T8GZR0_CALRO|nr:Hypothetical protein FKW44_014972 [Caligus rogercresseyi]
MNMVPIRCIEEMKATNIVWDITLSYPLTLVCRDDEKLDICNIEERSCLKRLVHEFKVLNAVIRDGIIISGCLHGLLVFWDLSAVLASNDFEITYESSLLILREHSAGIPDIYIDKDTIITDDYDGVVCIRKISLSSSLRSIFSQKQDTSGKISPTEE